MNEEQFDIFPSGLIADAIRDNGYKTTAHAIAELIDNSVQAGASTVQVICVEEPQLVNEREWNTVVTIAVLDDGEGMDPSTLRMALQFGNGTHLNDRKGIGRFGMGLPTSSFSQCEEVDVWSWQSGANNAIHSRLSLGEIRAGSMKRVPEPGAKAVPSSWDEISQDPLGRSGTLVTWNGLDRVNWRGAAATLRNTEFLVGRMYRKMIHEDGLQIRLVAVRNGEVDWEMDVRPNDPLYLMAPSCTTEPFQDVPMFRPWGEAHPIKVNLDDGKGHTITVRCSYATEEALLPQEGHPDPGNHPYGKHAKKNRGVSIVRARRELDLDPSWSDAYRDRWWGIEIEFPPALDEVFGVTNNKQAATNFSEMAAFFSDDTRVDEWEEMREEWRVTGDPRLHLMEVAHFIDQQRKLMRNKLEQARKGVRSGTDKRHKKREAEDLATEKIKERQAEYKAEVADETPSEKDLKQSIVNELVTAGGMTQDAARQVADSIVTLNRKIVFVRTDDDSNAFFAPKPIPGMHEVRLNINHPAYDQLIQVLDPTVEDQDAADLEKRLNRASDTLKLLLAAWTRYELEARSVSRSNIAETRREWGKMARLFLEDSANQ